MKPWIIQPATIGYASEFAMAVSRRTLHEAMQIVLTQQPDKTASTQFVSDEIARRKLYRQKTGGIAHKGQIRIRAIKYPKLFEMVERETVRLIG